MVKRKLTGAHYGLGDWVYQRVTAAVMLVYTVLLIVGLLFVPNTYEAWRGFFSCTIVQVFTQISVLALAVHAWVGVRDIWMDYIKPLSLRLTMHSLTLLWLAGVVIYSVKVIWGV